MLSGLDGFVVQLFQASDIFILTGIRWPALIQRGVWVMTWMTPTARVTSVGQHTQQLGGLRVTDRPLRVQTVPTQPHVAMS